MKKEMIKEPGKGTGKYKQTEIGIIPKDWSVDYIKNLALIKTGDKNTQDRIDNGLYPFFVRSQTIERINSYSFNGEAVLTAGDGVGVGKVMHYINEKFDFHQRVYCISNFAVNLNGYFFYLYFSNNFYNRIMQMTAKSSVDSVRMEMIADMKIPLPPTLAEQTAIATALTDADDLISNLEKLIEKKRNIKQGAMQQLLSPTTPDGKLKKGWTVKKMGEVVHILDNLRVPLNDNQRSKMNGDIPYCGANGIVGYVNDFLIDEAIILMAEDGGFFDQYKTRPIAYRMYGKCWVNNHAHILKATNEFYQDFIFYSIVNKNILDFINGGTRAKLNKGDLINIEISLPSDIIEQKNIAEILSDMDAEIELLEEKLSKSKMIKQGMMQELLTGKIRLV